MEALRSWHVSATLLAVGGCWLAGLGRSPLAQADEVVYLANVTVRPGYAFPDPDAPFGVWPRRVRGSITANPTVS